MALCAKTGFPGKRTGTKDERTVATDESFVSTDERSVAKDESFVATDERTAATGEGFVVRCGAHGKLLPLSFNKSEVASRIVRFHS